MLSVITAIDRRKLNCIFRHDVYIARIITATLLVNITNQQHAKKAQIAANDMFYTSDIYRQLEAAPNTTIRGRHSFSTRLYGGWHSCLY